MKTIVWDIDDVLNDLMRRWLEDEWLPENGDSSVSYADIRENPPCRLLGCSLDDYLASLDRFRMTKAALLKPNPEVLQWFHERGDRFRHVALTATPLVAAPVSAEWVIRHFGAWIRSFAFVPSPRRADPDLPYPRTKVDYLRWWGKGDVLIDDNPQHVKGAQCLEMRGLLFPRPWNGASHTPASVLAELSTL